MRSVALLGALCLLLQGCWTALAASQDLSVAHPVEQVEGVVKGKRAAAVRLRFACGRRALAPLRGSNPIVLDKRPRPEEYARLQRKGWVLHLSDSALYELVRLKSGAHTWQKLTFDETAHYTPWRVIGQVALALGGIILDATVVLAIAFIWHPDAWRLLAAHWEAFDSAAKSTQRRKRRTTAKSKRNTHDERPGFWEIHNRSKKPITITYQLKGSLRGNTIKPGRKLTIRATPRIYSYTLRQGKRRMKGTVELRSGLTAHTDWQALSPPSRPSFTSDPGGLRRASGTHLEPCR